MSRNTPETTEAFFQSVINCGNTYRSRTFPQIERIAARAVGLLKTRHTDTVRCAMRDDLADYFRPKVSTWSVNFNIAMRRGESELRWVGDSSDELAFARCLADYYQEFLNEELEKACANRT